MNEKEIESLAWKSIAFRDKLRYLRAERRRQRDALDSCTLGRTCDAYLRLASAYYSVLSTAFSIGKRAIHERRIVRVAHWLCSWFPLGAWSFFQMARYGEKAYRMEGFHGMSPEGCDIYQSVLRVQGRFGLAKRCIYYALSNYYLDMEPHTRGLLYAGLADIHLRDEEQNNAVVAIEKATRCVSYAEAKGAYAQASRILKQCARLLERLDWQEYAAIDRLKEEARRLALRADAADQIMKI